MVQAGVTTRSDVSSPESGALVGPRPAHGPAVMAGSGSTLLPARCFQAAESSRSEHCDTNLPAPNSQAVHGDRQSTPVNALPVCKSCGPSRTAHLCLAAASPGGEKRGCSPSVGDTRSHCGQRRPTVRCYGKHMCRPEQDVCHSCPALCAIIHYPGAVSGSATLSMWSFIKSGGVRGASPDLCQELREKIGYNY